MTEPLLGTAVPALNFASTEGKEVSFPRDLQGHWTVLYFYPQDDTPGCVKEACGFRDNLQQFAGKNVKIYGVSLDSMDSHHQFKSKYHLNFPLLVDVDHKLSDALGAYKGTSHLSRDTVLVDPDGKIRHIWRKVSTATTVQETYDKLLELM